MLRNSGLRWQTLSAGELFSVIYSELCFQAGGQKNAEANIERWMEEVKLLRLTAEAQARAARQAKIPMAQNVDEVAWADADRRALRSLSNAPSPE